MVPTPPGEHLSPFEAQRRMHELFAQETRHHVIQTILGHPEHLPSLLELSYYSQKSESAVLDQVAILADDELLTSYTLPENEAKRDLPGTFYGFTLRGVRMLEKFDYLRGLPMVRAIHENTSKTAQISRHEEAPRPPLPEPVADALASYAADAEMDPEAAGEEVLASVFADLADAAEAESIRDLFRS